MFNNPYGGAMGADNGAFMRMLPMLFGQKPGMGGGMQPGMGQRPQMPQQSMQQPQNDMFSGVNKVLDPNSNFMSNIMKSLSGGGAPPGGQRTGAPITNTPSTNMQNNPFMQMPWQNGGMKQGQ